MIIYLSVAAATALLIWIFLHGESEPTLTKTECVLMCLFWPVIPLVALCCIFNWPKD